MPQNTSNDCRCAIKKIISAQLFSINLILTFVFAKKTILNGELIIFHWSVKLQNHTLVFEPPEKNMRVEGIDRL